MATSYPLVAAASTVYNTPNTTTFLTPTTVATGNLTGLAAGELPVRNVEFLDLDINITAISGASAAITITLDRKGSDGIWYNVFNSGALTATGQTSKTVGPGAEVNKDFGNIARIGVFVSNTTTPSATLSVSAIAKSSPL
jgi:hypothetical protein